MCRICGLCAYLSFFYCFSLSCLSRSENSLTSWITTLLGRIETTFIYNLSLVYKKEDLTLPAPLSQTPFKDFPLVRVTSITTHETDEIWLKKTNILIFISVMIKMWKILLLSFWDNYVFNLQMFFTWSYSSEHVQENLHYWDVRRRLRNATPEAEAVVVNVGHCKMQFWYNTKFSYRVLIQKLRRCKKVQELVRQTQW